MCHLQNKKALVPLGDESRGSRGTTPPSGLQIGKHGMLASDEAGGIPHRAFPIGNPLTHGGHHPPAPANGRNSGDVYWATVRSVSAEPFGSQLRKDFRRGRRTRLTPTRARCSSARSPTRFHHGFGQDFSIAASACQGILPGVYSCLLYTSDAADDL